MGPLTAFQIAELLIKYGAPTVIKIVDVFNASDPDWPTLRARINQSFGSLAGERPDE